jgi:hypothetical protein
MFLDSFCSWLWPHFNFLFIPNGWWCNSASRCGRQSCGCQWRQFFLKKALKLSIQTNLKNIKKLFWFLRYCQCQIIIVNNGGYFET